MQASRDEAAARPPRMAAEQPAPTQAEAAKPLDMSVDGRLARLRELQLRDVAPPSPAAVITASATNEPAAMTPRSGGLQESRALKTELRQLGLSTKGSKAELRARLEASAASLPHEPEPEPEPALQPEPEPLPRPAPEPEEPQDDEEECAPVPQRAPLQIERSPLTQPAAQPQQAAPHVDRLSGLSVGELRKLAAAKDGVSHAAIEAARDGDDPKGDLIDLITAGMAQLTEEAQAEALDSRLADLRTFRTALAAEHHTPAAAAAVPAAAVAAVVPAVLTPEPVEGCVATAKACLASADFEGTRTALAQLTQHAPNHPELSTLAAALAAQRRSQRERKVVFQSGVALGFGVLANPLFGSDCLEGAYACVVSRMNTIGSCGAKGAAEESGLVNIGDLVIEVNGTSTGGMSYDVCTAWIKMDYTTTSSSSANKDEHLEVVFVRADKIPIRERQSRALERQIFIHASSRSRLAPDLQRSLVSLCNELADNETTAAAAKHLAQRCDDTGDIAGPALKQMLCEAG